MFDIYTCVFLLLGFILLVFQLKIDNQAGFIRFLVAAEKLIILKFIY